MSLLNKCLIRFSILFQESPESISVFDLRKRSNNGLEANNGTLGASVPKRAPFFRFILAMLEFEKQKSYEVALLVETGGASKPVQRPEYKVNVSLNSIYEKCYTQHYFMLSNLIFNK